ncbi:MAG: TdeIII family type II restriction endonuclease, partial [Candidatus Zixiibacteriota bacterium]
MIVTAGLSIGDFESGPFFAEIKSPLPNLDVAAESKRKLLTFVAMNTGRNPQAFLAFAYNPFLSREAYHHTFNNQIMDMKAEVLMGSEFW